MSEYAIRIERGGGSHDGDVVAVCLTLTEARESAEWWADRLDAVTAIYTLDPCYEEGPDE